MKTIRLITVLLAILVLVVACGSDEPTPVPQATSIPQPTETPTQEPTATPTPTPESKVAEGPPAAEIVGIEAWVNSEPLQLSDLKGKVVLIDVWTYTCVNCIRTIPFLKSWHAKYADDGLVIVGVHTPEFDFEKNLENVKEAVAKFGIAWPVALDNDKETWTAYKTRGWPSKYLIDKDGILRYTQFGEGKYAETEKQLRELLEEMGADLVELDPELPEFQAVDPIFASSPGNPVTNEIYAGWVRAIDASEFTSAYVGNDEYLQNPDKTVEYEDPEDHIAHRIYLQGPWFSGAESLRHDRETSNFEDYMRLRYGAKSVNVVINPEGEDIKPFKVLVTTGLEDEYLTEENKGEDVVIEEDGRSFLYVDEPRMYSVVQGPSYGLRWLKLSSNSPHFAVYAFTFGVFDSGV